MLDENFNFFWILLTILIDSTRIKINFLLFLSIYLWDISILMIFIYMWMIHVINFLIFLNSFFTKEGLYLFLKS